MLGESYTAARNPPPKKPLDLDEKTEDEVVAMASLLCVAEADLRLPLGEEIFTTDAPSGRAGDCRARYDGAAREKRGVCTSRRGK